METAIGTVADTTPDRARGETIWSVLEPILVPRDVLGEQRHLPQFRVGVLGHKKMMRCIELFGSEVAPVVRREVARQAAAS